MIRKLWLGGLEAAHDLGAQFVLRDKKLSSSISEGALLLGLVTQYLGRLHGSWLKLWVFFYQRDFESLAHLLAGDLWGSD